MDFLIGMFLKALNLIVFYLVIDFFLFQFGLVGFDFSNQNQTKLIFLDFLIEIIQ
jgi:hypothetical protein